MTDVLAPRRHRCAHFPPQDEPYDPLDREVQDSCKQIWDGLRVIAERDPKYRESISTALETWDQSPAGLCDIVLSWVMAEPKQFQVPLSVTAIGSHVIDRSSKQRRACNAILIRSAGHSGDAGREEAAAQDYAAGAGRGREAQRSSPHRQVRISVSICKYFFFFSVYSFSPSLNRLSIVTLCLSFFLSLYLCQETLHSCRHALAVICGVLTLPTGASRRS